MRSYFILALFCALLAIGADSSLHSENAAIEKINENVIKSTASKEQFQNKLARIAALRNARLRKVHADEKVFSRELQKYEKSLKHQKQDNDIFSSNHTMTDEETLFLNHLWEQFVLEYFATNPEGASGSSDDDSTRSGDHSGRKRVKISSAKIAALRASRERKIDAAKKVSSHELQKHEIAEKHKKLQDRKFSSAHKRNDDDMEFWSDGDFAAFFGEDANDDVEDNDNEDDNDNGDNNDNDADNGDNNDNDNDDGNDNDDDNDNGDDNDDASSKNDKNQIRMKFKNQHDLDEYYDWLYGPHHDEGKASGGELKKLFVKKFKNQHDLDKYFDWLYDWPHHDEGKKKKVPTATLR